MWYTINCSRAFTLRYTRDGVNNKMFIRVILLSLRLRKYYKQVSDKHMSFVQKAFECVYVKYSKNQRVHVVYRGILIMHRYGFTCERLYHVVAKPTHVLFDDIPRINVDYLNSSIEKNAAVSFFISTFYYLQKVSIKVSIKTFGC